MKLKYQVTQASTKWAKDPKIRPVDAIWPFGFYYQRWFLTFGADQKGGLRNARVNILFMQHSQSFWFADLSPKMVEAIHSSPRNMLRGLIWKVPEQAFWLAVQMSIQLLKKIIKKKKKEKKEQDRWSETIKHTIPKISQNERSVFVVAMAPVYQPGLSSSAWRHER